MSTGKIGKRNVEIATCNVQHLVVYQESPPAGVKIFTQPTAAAPGVGTTITLTADELLTGILADTPGGAATWTLPAADDLVAAISGVNVNDAFTFCVINKDDTNTITLASTTTVGGMVVQPAAVSGENNSGSGLFEVVFTDVTASAEAYTLYRLA